MPPRDSATDTVYVAAGVLLGPRGATARLSIDGASGNVRSTGSLNIAGQTTLNATRMVGDTRFDAAVHLNKRVTMGGGVTMSGPAVLGSTLDVDGQTRLKAGVVLSGSGTALTVMHDTVLGSNLFDSLTVKAKAEMHEAVELHHMFTVGKPGGVHAFRVRAPLTMQDSQQRATVTIDPKFGDITTQGRLSVRGDSALKKLTVSDTAQLNGDVVLGVTPKHLLKVVATASFHSPVTLGESSADTISVHGGAVFYEDLTARRSLNALSNVMIGDSGFDQLVVNAGATFVTQLKAKGTVELGDSAQDSLVVRSQFVVRDGLHNRLTINPATGALATEGPLKVKGKSEFDAAVTLGALPKDSIKVLGTATFHTAVTLGDDALDAIQVRGHASFTAPVELSTKAPLKALGGLVVGTAGGGGSATIHGAAGFSGDLEVKGVLKTRGSQVIMYSTLLLRDKLEQTAIRVEVASGDVTARGQVNAAGAALGTLSVSRASALRGGLTVGNTSVANPLLSASLAVGGHASFEGRLLVKGAGANGAAAVGLDVSGTSMFRGNVDLDTKSSLVAAGSVTLGSGPTQSTRVRATATFDAKLACAADVVLGDSRGHDLTVVAGRLRVVHNHVAVLSVSPESIENYPKTGQHVQRGVFVHSNFTVEQLAHLRDLRVTGDTELSGGVTLGSSLSKVMVHGALAVTGNTVLGNAHPNAKSTTLEVRSATTLHKTLQVLAGATFGTNSAQKFTVKAVAAFAASVNISGSTQLGDTGRDTVVQYARLRVLDADDKLTYSLASSSGSVYSMGSLQFLGSSKLGDHASDSTAVTGAFYVGKTVDGSRMLSVNPVSKRLSVSADLIEAAGNVRLSGDLFLLANGSSMFDVKAKTGNTVIRGDLTVYGNLLTQDKPLRVRTLYADVIIGNNNASGVNVEGVQFRNGGFALARADVINELTSGNGVHVDGVQLHNGAIVLDSHNPGVNPKGETHIMTIINSGHAWDMDGTITSIIFKQYFHNSDGKTHVAANAGKLKIGTETDWTQSGATQNAYISFETVHKGGLFERLRMAANGDISFTKSRFHFKADSGDTTIRGNLLVGGQSGQRSARVTSTDSESLLHVKSAAGTKKSARFMLSGDFAEARLVSAQAKDARFVLMDAREDGYAWARAGSGNLLSLDRIQRGKGQAVSVAAGSTSVVSQFDGDFAQIHVGDHILINVDCASGVAANCEFGEVQSRTVVKLLPAAGATDMLVVDSAFSATKKLTTRPYYVARRISSVSDDHSMTFGGASGPKAFRVVSTDMSATVDVHAKGARHLASAVVTGEDDAELHAMAGTAHAARLELSEAGGAGFMLARGDGAANRLRLYRTILGKATLKVTAGSNKLSAAGAGVIPDVRVGDYIVVEVAGVKELRKVTAVDTAANPDTLTLETALDGATNVAATKYTVARPTIAFNDDNEVLVGGARGAKVLRLTSLDNAVDFTMAAAGAAHEAKLSVRGDDNVALELMSGSNDDARIKLLDATNVRGFTLARRNEGTGKFVNVFSVDSTEASPAGATVSIASGSTKLTSSGNLFGAVHLGDYITMVWANVEYTRKVIAVNTAADPDTLTLDVRVSGSFNVVKAKYSVARRVLEFRDKDFTIIGGNSGAKSLIFGSSDNSATMTVTSTGAGNEAVLGLTSVDDTAALSIDAGRNQEARLSLRDYDSKKGYRLRRTAAGNDFNLERTWGGPGGTITTYAAGAKKIYSAKNGDFTTLRVGDRLVVIVEKRTVTRTIVSIDLNPSPDTLIVDAAFSAASKLQAVAYEVAKPVLVVNAQDEMTVGASSGNKKLLLTSTDANSVLSIVAKAKNMIASVDVQGDVSVVDINSGAARDTKLKLRDRDNGRGFVLTREGVNSLTLQRTLYAGGSTVTVLDMESQKKGRAGFKLQNTTLHFSFSYSFTIPVSLFIFVRV